ncbi:hypothetical protein CBR_g31525 [Chara braunii]|uniref:RRM domain-containing protein n=1 Tax=Chara braunii TaxID=69332 RepID=A0A388LF89_CHABU|nr:hypothetical protein CBR_g31525 [Chara braunii]|eukprot:GBG80968.1 hypothetical protein CBR_g31525 [Chara braunii]
MENGVKRKLEEGPSEFEQKVRRTVFLDEIAPQVTVAIMQSALSQFGKVTSMKLVNHPLDPLVPQGCALIEFANEEQAMRVAATTRKNLLMVGGMPRPVRARMASKYMFDSAEVERSNLHHHHQKQQQKKKQEKEEDEKEKAKQEEERSSKWKLSVLTLGDAKRDKAEKLKQVRARQAAEIKMLLEKHEEQRAELHKRQESHWEDEFKKLDAINKAGKQHGVDELRAFFGMGPQQK